MTLKEDLWPIRQDGRMHPNIARTWRGAVRRADASAYAAYVRDTGLVEYAGTPGNRGAWILRRDDGELAEIVTLSFWDDLESIRAFAGDDIETAVFYPEDDRYLVRRETKAVHYEVVDRVAPTPDRDSGWAIVEAGQYVTLGTADSDGRPWVAPVWYAHAARGVLYWVSRPEARHSQNLDGRPEASGVIFDSQVAAGSGTGVYLSGTAGRVPDDELEEAMAVYSRRAVAVGLDPWPVERVTGSAPLRLYRFSAVEAWTLDERDRRVPLEL
jgi:nitroimidazol reductase NimA-like FMN-containing flavoprotein (pyridoxamine 5'-phosphate oxidase superfamily)/heme-degrading monooxygenase HmoA